MTTTKCPVMALESPTWGSNGIGGTIERTPALPSEIAPFPTPLTAEERERFQRTIDALCVEASRRLALIDWRERQTV